MSDIFFTVPSFTINKKEFLTLWAKNYILGLNKRILSNYDADIHDFLIAFGLIKEDAFNGEQLQEDELAICS